MKAIRRILVPAMALVLFGVGGAVRAESLGLHYGSPGISIGLKSGHAYHKHKGYYGHSRYYQKRHYRTYPRYWHGKRHGYWHGKRYGHYKPGFRHYRPGYRHHGRRHTYRGHRGWRH